jgi:hypothetical protein
VGDLRILHHEKRSRSRKYLGKNLAFWASHRADTRFDARSPPLFSDKQIFTRYGGTSQKRQQPAFISQNKVAARVKRRT